MILGPPSSTVLGPEEEVLLGFLRAEYYPGYLIMDAQGISGARDQTRVATWKK